MTQENVGWEQVLDHTGRGGNPGFHNNGDNGGGFVFRSYALLRRSGTDS